MYVAAVLFVFISLTATSQADHHLHPCHSPNMTGTMIVMTMKGEIRGYGAFTYDSMGKKLRFRSNDSLNFNTTLSVDLLMFFEEGIFYEIDSKNQTCEKKALQCRLHPLDIPDDAKFHSTITSGNPFIEGEGIKINVWSGSLMDKKGHYSMSATMGCLPISSLYFTEPSSFIVSNFDVEYEIKDPELLAVPSFCQGQPLEETPEGTVNSFLNEFI
ncbi:ependymin [Gouania willdenowi]|uniref:Ependymin-2-like n=1 Tax=Gouania willdenowi TaxID=441366 RepID=A0A8C5DW35_GOUWI|nr:ependymin-2-like [Gouania willdenowi]